MASPNIVVLTPSKTQSRVECFLEAIVVDKEHDPIV